MHAGNGKSVLNVELLLLYKKDDAHAQDEMNGDCNRKYFVSLTPESLHVVGHSCNKETSYRDNQEVKCARMAYGTLYLHRKRNTVEEFIRFYEQ
jgi:hypothetical protein